MDLSAASLNMLRSWHWFYQFEMAGRTSDAYRRAFWRASRARLRALILTQFGHGVPDVPNTAATGTCHAVIWDLYTPAVSLVVLLNNQDAASKRTVHRRQVCTVVLS